MLLQCWVVPAVRLAFWCAEPTRYDFWGTVHPWDPLQGFRGHPPVKGGYEGEEVIPWVVTTEMARTWAYAGLQLQELQVPLQPGILLTVPGPFIWA